MGSNWRNCKKCGQKIILARMPQGHWLALDPDGSGRHYCRSRADSSYRTTPALEMVREVVARPARSWKLESLGRSLTYPTTCWWCGDDVFFHTNGNGDCVLFDALGWPWEVHPCWEDHRNLASRRERIARFEDALQDQGYDGIRIEPSQVLVYGPDDEDHRYVFVSGYVTRESGDPHQRETVDLSLDKEPVEWLRMDVATADGKLFPFYIPELIDGLIPEYSLVRVSGRWSVRKQTWLLLTTRIEWVRYPDGGRMRLRITRFGRKACCRYCGCRLDPNGGWGINRSFRVECSACSEFRAGRDPKDFEAFCCRLLKARRFRRTTTELG